jgi:glycosyltransferase involved in cell wall biosynthesis
VKRRGTVAFVPSRYGTDVVGGAETVMREQAHGLAERGWDVEVLTTCARDHYSWANEYPPGTEQVGAVTVRRFPAVVSTPRTERAVLGDAIGRGLGAVMTLAEQQRWMNDDMRVPELFHYLLDNHSRYRTLVFGPYLFWTALACSQIAPGRSLLWACVHDEPQVRLEIFKPMFAGVAGLWFQAEPEHELAHRVFDRLAAHRVVGCGIDVPKAYDPDGFRARHGIDGRFLLYAGRRESAKGWNDLLRGFAAATRRHDLPFALVTMGTGEVAVPEDLRELVIDVGFLPDEERDNAFAAADACLQPSAYEAFSRTVMEAWLAGSLVIANAASAVVTWHCERSGAGLTYGSDAELEQCLLFLADAPESAAALAATGRRYVLEHYAFPDVLDRIEAGIEEWTPAQ